MTENYYILEFTKEELDQVSIALKDRIDILLQRLNTSRTPEAKRVITDLIQSCITAQKQITALNQELKAENQKLRQELADQAVQRAMDRAESREKKN